MLISHFLWGKDEWSGGGDGRLHLWIEKKMELDEDDDVVG